jgi:NADPH-dependent glutamate synthase beta subunit-like oxidoreductase
MARYPIAGVIGAGPSGIAAAKTLLERGVPFTVFEASDRAGGNCVFGNRNGDEDADADDGGDRRAPA